MLISQTAPDCRESCASPVAKGFSSRLDLYVDLGIRPSSCTFFSELGIDLYVDLSIRDGDVGGGGDGGFLPKTTEWATELGLLREDSNRLPKELDPLYDLTVDDSHRSLEQTEKLVLPDKLTTEPSVAETCTGTAEEDVENVHVAATLGDKHAGNVDVFSLRELESAADPASLKNGGDIHTFQPSSSNITDLLQDTKSSRARAVDGDATLTINVWDDAEIVAIHGLTELRDEVKFEEEKHSCRSMEVEVPNSITRGFKRGNQSAVLPSDELYHLRLHLECLSRRVRRCRARVGQSKLGSDVNRVKPLEVHLYKRERNNKLQRGKLLSSRNNRIDCRCSKRPLQQAFRSVRNLM